MIFKRLFKTNTWEHKDSTVRITAIQNELSINNVEQAQILNTMLNNDHSELVRRAVLHKINRFEDWVSASQKNSNSNIREFALSTVKDIVLGYHELKLSEEEKQGVLNSGCKSQLLESWLKKETSPDLVLKIFTKINKPQLLVPTFVAHQDEDVQLALLSTVDDIVVLEKLLKKVKLPKVSEQLKNKLATIRDIQEKPNKLLKRTQLVLAKFLALKDVTIYEEVINKSESLEKEWQELFSQFCVLESETQQDLVNKLADIKNQLQKLFAHKAEAYEQQKIANQLEETKKLERHEFSKQLNTLDEQLSNAIFENNEINDVTFKDKLEELRTLVSNSSLNKRDREGYLYKVDALIGKLSRLPEIAESVTEATHLISKMSQAILPKDLSDVCDKEVQFTDWLNQWKQVSVKANNVLPQSLVSSYKEIVSSWTEALKPIHELQKKNFFQTQRKLKDVERLIDQGKYKAAFGVFKKAEQSYLILNASQQLKLEREFNKTKASVDDLSDWENYIATPKKQLLLQEIITLAETPHDNPSKQAKAVKDYRSRWNSLGHADEEIDKELNVKFNEACEKAFAPCRQFYSEQEKVREQHLVNRTALINKAKDFVSSIDYDDCDWKSISAKINQLKQKWRESGEVERSLYKELNVQFNQLLKPVSEGVEQYNSENIVKKESLLKRAQELTELDDVFKAVQETKSLQAHWKSIGHCGAREENRLWKQFRMLNDLVFDKRAKQQSREKDKLSALIEQHQLDFNKIKIDVSQCSITKDLKMLDQKLDSLISSIKALSGKELSLSKAIERVQKDIANKIVAIENADSKQVWHDIFNVLEFSLKGDASECNVFDNLPVQLSKKIVANTGEANIDARLERTIELEILASKESPEIDKEKRFAIQVDLMQQQIESGQAIDVEDKFWQWLQLGKLTNADAPLLERAKQIMLVN